MTALLALLAVLVVASTAKKKGLRPPPGREVPIGPGAENFESVGEYLAYKRPIANALIEGLLWRIAVPTEQPNVLLVLPGTAPMGPNEWGAYYGLKSLHDEGYAIWVPLTFHWPDAAATGQFVIFLPPGEAPPADYALLIMPDEPWPELAPDQPLPMSPN